MQVASHADVLRGSSRVPAPRTSAWEASVQVYLCDFGENGHKPEATSGARSNRLLTQLEANTTFSILSHSSKKCQLKHVPHNKLVHNMIIIEVFFPFFNGFYEIV